MMNVTSAVLGLIQAPEEPPSQPIAGALGSRLEHDGVALVASVIFISKDLAETPCP